MWYAYRLLEVSYWQYTVALCTTTSQYLPITHGAFSPSLHLSLTLALFAGVALALPCILLLYLTSRHTKLFFKFCFFCQSQLSVAHSLPAAGSLVPALSLFLFFLVLIVEQLDPNFVKNSEFPHNPPHFPSLPSFFHRHYCI